MPKFNDTQYVLLSMAAQRDSGSLYPLPETLTAGDRVTAAITKLLANAMVEERESGDADAVHRIDDDLRFGLFVTPAGLLAIGIEQSASDGNEAPSPAPPAVTTPRETKAAQVVALLSRRDGATLPELIEATGCLPHTTRAALTGLRKKGYAIERSKRGDVTCYGIIATEAA